MPVILTTQEAEIRRIEVQSQPGEIVLKIYLEKPFTKIGPVEWLKVKALSSSPGSAKKKKKSKSVATFPHEKELGIATWYLPKASLSPWRKQAK
jgi:hypothetical protein